MPPSGWAELYAWHLDRASATPLTRQIYRQVRAGILSGGLGPGAKLPSTRDLARRLSVARVSVVAAYEQLHAEGYIVGRAGAGSFVSSDLTGLVARRAQPRRARPRALPAAALAFTAFEPSTAQLERRPFNTGRTLVDARTVEVWRTLTHRAVGRLGPEHLGYTDPCGFIELRRAITDYLRAARAVRCEPEQIVVTAGTQQAIDIAIRVLVAPGDEVWVEDPGYALTHGQLLLAKARLRP